MNNQVFFSIIRAFLFAGTSALLFTGCGSDKDQTYRSNSEFFDQLSPEDQNKYAPSSLFRAIYQNNSSEFEVALNENIDKLIQKNSVFESPLTNDTPLAAAIKLKRTYMIQKIIERMTYDDLRTPNAEGRSYISLLAEIDDIDSFQVLQKKYQQRIDFLRTIKPTEEFSNYDFPDDMGRNAAHFVQSRAFLDILASTWFFRAMDKTTIWSNLFYQYDNDGNSFLHSAAKYNKFEVISWYTKGTCGAEPWEGGNMLTQGIDGIFYGIGKFVQYFQDNEYAFIFWRKLINEKNKDGDSAIHIAAQRASYEALRALIRCEEANPVLENIKGQPPLTSMLYQLSLNQFEDSFSEDYKKTFSLLINQINPMTIMPGYTFKYYLNLPDLSGNNAIFYASKLTDKYFYNKLLEYNLDQENADGIRPSDNQ